jgi:hypothetical protein
MAKKNIKVTSSNIATSDSSTIQSTQNQDSGLLFGKKNYMIVLAGLVVMFIGFLLMAGGHMPSREVWDESLIYSPVRMTVAPILILAGLGLQIYAIFAKK